MKRIKLAWVGALLCVSCGSADLADVSPSAGSRTLVCALPLNSGTPWLETGAIESVDCRPVDEPWVEGSPLRLPCQRTEEPCDGIDNDQDGMLDPHCPTVPCEADRDCTFGRLLLDADCNDWGDGFGHPVCNQIDGPPGDGSPSKCWGVLCPPGLKCYAGDCLPPGSQAPNTRCTSGADCPMNAGCIPDSPGDDPTAICRYNCQHVPCPAGWVCIDRTSDGVGGIAVEHRTCAWPFECDQPNHGCDAAIDACVRLEGCPSEVECLRTCRYDGRADCEISCMGEQAICGPALDVIECLEQACSPPGRAAPGAR